MNKKSLVVGALGAALLSSLLGNTSYKVNQVIDGDTFETTEHQFIRLADTNAPEKGLCGSIEAQKAGFTKGSDCFNKTFHPGQ